MRIPLLLVLASAAPAQLVPAYTTSPPGYATREGRSNNVFPWARNQARYQQIHSDLRGASQIVSALGWRRDGSFARRAAGTLDLELSVGNSDYAKRNTSFQQNYIGSPTIAVKRKKVQFPSWSVKLAAPGPFDFVLPFDKPWVFGGKSDFLWDVKVWSNTNAPSNAIADAHQGAIAGRDGRSFELGKGCVTDRATNSRMTLTAAFVTSGSSLTMQWMCFFAPKSSSSNVLLLGIKNPGVTIPGLCSGKLYTDAILSLPMPASSSTGVWKSSVVNSPYWPALGGMSFFAQAVSRDASQTGLPFAASNGLQTMVAKPGTAGTYCRIYDVNNVNAPVGRITVNYCLVTRIYGI